MKKSIKADLVSLAHRILQLKDDVPYEKLSAEAREVYEKLTLLAYAEKLESQGREKDVLADIEEGVSTLLPDGKAGSRKLPENGQEQTKDTTVSEPEIKTTQATEPARPRTKTPAEIAAENEARFTEARVTDKHRPDGTQYNTTDAPAHEPVIEKIKDMWPEMTPDAAAIDELVEAIEPKNYQKNDMLEIGGEYAQMPIFEPVDAAVEDDKPKNLNDKLKAGLKIGLNDKIAFIKHLFNGSDTDYNRVLSQLETFSTAAEAQKFVAEMVKPDYNHWEGKEVYEERFMQVIENKFD